MQIPEHKAERSMSWLQRHWDQINNERKLVLVLQYNILVDIYIKTQQEQQTQVD